MARKFPPWPSKVWRYRTVKGIDKGWDVIDVFHNNYTTISNHPTKKKADAARDLLNDASVYSYINGGQP